MQEFPFKQYKNSFVIVIFFAIWGNWLFAEMECLIPINIDGFNRVIFNQEYPNNSYNMYSLIFGDPFDNYPFTILPKYNNFYTNYTKQKTESINDSSYNLHLYGKIGSEIGEPLLNKYNQRGAENRDHFSHFAVGTKLPKKPISLFIGYRYSDSYSDYFDRQWSEYLQSTGKHMAFDNEALGYEISGGFSLYNPRITFAIKALHYRHWGTTPFYFSPFYSTGNLLLPSLFLNLRKNIFDIDIFIDYHKKYYKRTNFTKYTDIGWDIAWDRKLAFGPQVSLSHCKNPKRYPSTYLKAMVTDTVTDIFSWTILGKCFGNFRSGGSLGISYIQIPKIALNIDAGWNFQPKEREYQFLEKNTTVEYYSKMYDYASLHSSLDYFDTLFFPINATIWVDYCQNPLWEIVEFYNEKTLIKQDIIKNGTTITSGGKTSYEIALNNFLFTLWGNFSLHPYKKETRFSIPWNIGVNVSYGRPDNDSLYAAIKINARGPTSLRYLYKNYVNIANETLLGFTSISQTSIYFQTRIPFNLPFLKKYLHTNLQIEVGPIHPFNRKTRIKEHPLGNPIGPVISLAFNGYFYN